MSKRNSMGGAPPRTIWLGEPSSGCTEVSLFKMGTQALFTSFLPSLAARWNFGFVIWSRSITTLTTRLTNLKNSKTSTKVSLKNFNAWSRKNSKTSFLTAASCHKGTRQHRVTKEPGNRQSQEGFPKDITQPAAGGLQETPDQLTTQLKASRSNKSLLSYFLGELICMQ